MGNEMPTGNESRFRDVLGNSWTMSDHTESIRRWYGFNWASTASRRDGLARAEEICAEDFEYHFASEVSDRSLHGLDDIDNFMLAVEEDFRDFRQCAHRVLGDDERVVVIGEIEGRGRLSGLTFRTPFGHVWTLQEGLAVRVDEYVSGEQALAAAAGLEGEDAPNPSSATMEDF